MPSPHRKTKVNWPALAFGLSLVVVVVALISTYTRQADAVDTLRAQVGEFAQKFSTHTSNTSIHIDPQRDEERWERLYRELAEIKQDIKEARGDGGGRIPSRRANVARLEAPASLPPREASPIAVAKPSGEGPDLVGLFKKLGRKLAGKNGK